VSWKLTVWLRCGIEVGLATSKKVLPGHGESEVL